MSRRFGRGASQAVACSWRGVRSAACVGRLQHASAACAGASSRRKTDRLLIAPQDLRTADATRASEIYAGRFAFAGKVVICDGRSPFEMTPPSDEWAASLLGFGWLRHLRAAEFGDHPRQCARAGRRLDHAAGLAGIRWPGGRRSCRAAIISWLSQAPLMLQDADVAFYRRFMRSLTRQVRYLRHTAARSARRRAAPAGAIALTYAALCMAEPGAAHLRRRRKRLVDELDRQILPDGGHISRNPGALIELLLDLLPLRQAFPARNLPPPPALLNAIDRMMPMLRFFRHGDGNFAHVQRHGTDRRPTCSPPCSPMTMRAARRSRTRRIPAISASKPDDRCC